jgi:hypothetical protein
MSLNETKEPNGSRSLSCGSWCTISSCLSKVLTQFILCVIVSLSVKETKENNDSHSLLCNSRHSASSCVFNSHDPLHLVGDRLHILAQLPHPAVLEVCSVIQSFFPGLVDVSILVTVL